MERYHRNYKYECQLITQPHDLASTVESNQPYVHFYNYERPNQAKTCENQPPLMKFPNPPRLSPVPQTIDPDRWVLALSGKVYKRKLDCKGAFQLGDQTYYVQQKLRGRSILVWVDGPQRELAIYLDQKPIKKLPIKGLHNRFLNFPDYLELICKEGASTWRRLLRRTPTYR